MPVSQAILSKLPFTVPLSQSSSQPYPFIFMQHFNIYINLQHFILLTPPNPCMRKMTSLKKLVKLISLKLHNETINMNVNIKPIILTTQHSYHNLFHRVSLKLKTSVYLKLHNVAALHLSYMKTPDMPLTEKILLLLR